MADTAPPPVPADLPPPYNASSSTPTGTVSTLPTHPRLPLPLDLPSLSALRSKRLILASASPRRKHLLAQLGLRDVEVIPSNTPEDLPKTLSPFEYVLQTASQKAMAVYRREIDNAARGEPALVLAADTVVVAASGDILEKPRSEREHVGMLRALRDGGVHRVFTAVAGMAPLLSAVAPGYVMKTCVEETAVTFDPRVTDELIMAYVRTREGVDKAGGYGIQGMGAVLVEKIEGSFDNVVGLPLRATLRLIEELMAHNEEDGFGVPHGEDGEGEGEEEEE